jgi:uncharacterized protein YebE (UPF0316 family)
MDTVAGPAAFGGSQRALAAESWQIGVPEVPVMAFISTLPLSVLVVFVFLLRVVDVSLGTIRTIAIVAGRLRIAVVLGFLEVLIWISVISQVIARIHESPLVALAFAGGFATGNAVGIFLERRLAFGDAVIRIISTVGGAAVADAIRGTGQVVTTFNGEGRDGPVTMVYAFCPRRRVRELVAVARAVDSGVFCAVERADAWTVGRRPIGHPTGWRAIAKKK